MRSGAPRGGGVTKVGVFRFSSEANLIAVPRAFFVFWAVSREFFEGRARLLSDVAQAWEGQCRSGHAKLLRITSRDAVKRRNILG